MTYEDIQKANGLIQKTQIKGKDYAEVNQRIKAFRSVCPNGAIETELIKDDGEVCMMRAVVKDDSERILGTGMAFEVKGGSYINKTSYIENCETSAVGRALGVCGFGIDTSVASAEEVTNAIAQQEASKPINDIKKTALLEELHRVGWPANDMLEYLRNKYPNVPFKSINEITEAQFAPLAAMLRKKPDCSASESENG